MRVLMTMEASWHRVPGGTARAGLGLARALDRRSDVALTGLSASHRRPAHAGLEPPMSVLQHRLPRPALYEAWSRCDRPRARRCAQFDLVHATSLIAPPTDGVPLVVNVNDLAFRRMPERFGRRARRLFERAWKRVLERADVVVSPSQATCDDLVAAGLPQRRLRLIPQACEPVAVSPDAMGELRRRFGIDGRFVLCVGTLEPRKNLGLLIAAFSLVRSRCDLHLVIAGPSGWGVSASQLVAPLDASQRARVVLTGSLDDAELAALYAACDVFCYPSRLEGFGLPVLEAMSQGAPTVVCSGTSTVEIGGDAVIAVDPDDPAALAAALRRVLEDGSTAERMRGCSLARAGAFSWDRAAEQTAELYRSMLRP